MLGPEVRFKLVLVCGFQHAAKPHDRSIFEVISFVDHSWDVSVHEFGIRVDVVRAKDCCTIWKAAPGGRSVLASRQP
jgi:hypothetical protein